MRNVLAALTRVPTRHSSPRCPQRRYSRLPQDQHRRGRRHRHLHPRQRWQARHQSQPQKPARRRTRRPHPRTSHSATRPTSKPPAATSTPTNKQHGTLNPMGHHNGDLPQNVTIGEDHTGQATFKVDYLSLDPAAPNSIFANGGTSIMVHEKPDDMKTDPTGNAGNRIACGVITAPNPLKVARFQQPLNQPERPCVYRNHGRSAHGDSDFGQGQIFQLPVGDPARRAPPDSLPARTRSPDPPTNQSSARFTRYTSPYRPNTARGKVGAHPRTGSRK